MKMQTNFGQRLSRNDDENERFYSIENKKTKTNS